MSYAAINHPSARTDVPRGLRRQTIQQDERNLRQAVPGKSGESDMLALILWPYADPQLRAELHRLGVAVSFAPTQQVFQAALQGLHPELLLVDPDTLTDAAKLNVTPQTPLVVMSAAARGQVGEPIPGFIRAALARSVAEVRTRQAEQQAQARQTQLKQELQMLADMSVQFNANRTPDQVMQQVMQLVRDLFDIASGALYRYDRATGRFITALVITSTPIALDQEPLLADLDNAMWVVGDSEIGQIVEHPDLACCVGVPNQGDEHTQTVLCAPLIAQGRLWGVIQLADPLHGSFTQRDIIVLRLVAAMGGPCLAVKA